MSTNEDRVNMYRESHRRCRTCVHAKVRSFEWECLAKKETHSGGRIGRFKGCLCALYTPANYEREHIIYAYAVGGRSL